MMKKMKKNLFVVIPFLLLLPISLIPSCTNVGASIMEKEGCVQCHKFRGKGGNAGPDLTGVTKTRTDDWIKEKIKNPKNSNSKSAMPSYSHLTENDISAIISYMKS